MLGSSFFMYDKKLTTELAVSSCGSCRFWKVIAMADPPHATPYVVARKGQPAIDSAAR